MIAPLWDRRDRRDDLSLSAQDRSCIDDALALYQAPRVDEDRALIATTLAAILEIALTFAAKLPPPAALDSMRAIAMTAASAAPLIAMAPLPLAVDTRALVLEMLRAAYGGPASN